MNAKILEARIDVFFNRVINSDLPLEERREAQTEMYSLISQRADSTIKEMENSKRLTKQLDDIGSR